MSRDMQLASRIETSTYGTVTHMPPELLTDGKLSRAADVYSFGVILNEMYCGTASGFRIRLLPDDRNTGQVQQACPADCVRQQKPQCVTVETSLRCDHEGGCYNWRPYTKLQPTPRPVLERTVLIVLQACGRGRR